MTDSITAIGIMFLVIMPLVAGFVLKKGIFSLSTKYVITYSVILSILIILVSFPYKVWTPSLDAGDIFYGFPVGWFVESWSSWTHSTSVGLNYFGFFLDFVYWFFIFYVSIKLLTKSKQHAESAF
jgi:hypothetical protein